MKANNEKKAEYNYLCKRVPISSSKYLLTVVLTIVEKF